MAHHSRELLQIIVDKAVRPLVDQIAAEAGQQVSITFALWVDGRAAALTTMTLGSATAKPVANGEVRVGIKRSDEASHTFESQAIIHGLAPGTGLSGFGLHGKIVAQDDAWIAKRTGMSIHYNVWTWSPKLR